MTAQEKINNIYGFDFPSDFFLFHKFIKRIEGDDKLKGKYDQGLGLLSMYPGPPFAIFDDDFNTEQKDIIETGRFAADPPEFFTVLYGDTDGLHWGYYIDEPSAAQPTFWVASYYAKDAFSIGANNRTLFEESRERLESYYQNHVDDLISKNDEEELVYAKEQVRLLERLREILMEYETGDRKEVGRKYEEKYRDSYPRKTIASTRCDIGIVADESLFRPLPGKDKFKIWNYHPNETEAQQLHEMALEAIAQGFPATALKIGKDLWIYQEYNRITHEILHAAYTSMGRLILSGILEKYCMAKGILHTPEFQAELEQADTLEILDLSYKKIADLPEEISRFKPLKILFLSGNELDYLPEGIGHLSQLEFLGLTNNNFIEAPEIIGQLERLKTLHLSKNAITELPDSFIGLKNLEELHLEHTRLSEFPMVICSLKKLKKLIITGSRFSALPDELNQLENLEELEIRSASGNWIMEFPQKLDNLKRLKKLRFYSKYNDNHPPFPLSFCDLINLEELEVSRFFEYPNEMTRLNNLTYLKINNYQLTAFPEVIFTLKNLKKLHASCCRLEGIPENISALQALEDIYLHGNKIKKIPEALALLPNLKDFNIGFNELPKKEIKKLETMLPNVNIVCGNQHV